MNKWCSFLGILCYTLMLCGCKPGVAVEDISPDRLLSISGFVSPLDSIISIHVYKGQKIGTVIRSDSARVVDAKVSISDGNKTANLLYNAAAKRYEAENLFLNAAAGTILTLNVMTPEQVSASATAVIPPRPFEPSVKGKRIGNDYVFSVEWDNNYAYKYYNVWAEVEGEIRSSIGIFPLIASIDIPGSGFYFPSDKQNAGLNSETGIVNSAYEATSEQVLLSVTVANVDETFFKFYKSYRDYQDWLANTGDKLPNFSEAVPVFSNIRNGTGYFAAFSPYKVTVQIK